jgi:hypothetical protein
MRRTIRAVKFQAMYQAVQSKVIVEYFENDSYSFCIEYGTVEELCNKYVIKKIGEDLYDVSHLKGRECELDIKNGKTVFVKYY